MAEEDILFGKNMHMFGGIEPSNMTEFSATVADGHVRISATLPSDTVVDSQTLCTVGGAIIRRKVTNYPENEFDGTLVADIKESTTFVDADTSADGTYYYSAFPYTTQGVYNRSAVNRIVINEPSPMVSFTSKYGIINSTTVFVTLTADLPDGVAGAVIRKSTTGYPLTETDGTLVADITADGSCTDNDVQPNVSYFYTAFPYNSDGAYNRSISNRTYIVPKACGYMFGYDLKNPHESSDPSEMVIYPSDVDNYGFTPASMDYTSGIFNYGSWTIAPGEKFMPKPCMLAYDGTVTYYLDPNDYSKQTDGTASVINQSFNGNAMMEWPKIYTKRWISYPGAIYHFRCSDTKIDDTWECWCNYDIHNDQIDHFYTAIYSGAMADSCLRSISNAYPNVNEIYSTSITYATKNDRGTYEQWYIDVLSDVLLINDLLVMMGKSTDGQTVYGYGYCSSKNTSTLISGTMNDKGMFWGANDGTSGVKVFGMENYWGNISRRVAGLNIVDGLYKYKITRGTHDGSTAAEYNTDSTGYLSYSNQYSEDHAPWGYITEMATLGDFGLIAGWADGGSSSTYYCDEMHTTSTGSACAIRGGGYALGLPAGPFYLDISHDTSYRAYSVGAALSCKPTLER